MANDYLIRCPVCLTEQAVRKNTPVYQELACGGCKKPFRFMDALPALEQQTRLADTVVFDSTPSDELPITLTMWVIGLVVVVAFVQWSRTYVSTMSGPEFMGFFLVVFAVLWMGSFLLRWR